ncbi:hypothetical protein Q7A53_19020 [Halobacillus rhizosphaerae]|uniref:hypothetical protein n=1 Tax=Halobacillus rhizosphaerae TaxID=3064889 RepID=UPI00398B2098
MDILIFYLSPVVGFVFMLTLIMTFVALAGGRPVKRINKWLLISSLVIIIGMFSYLSL